MHTKFRNIQSKTPLVRAIHAAFLSTALAMSISAVHAAEKNDQTVQNDYSIASGQLGQALSNFALQSGIALSFDPELTKNLNTQGLKGKYTVTQGFAQLLMGTNLQLAKHADGTFTLVQINQVAPVPQVRDMGQLRTIDVTATGTANQNAANVAQLPIITVTAEQNGSANDGYVTKNITGVGLWGERSLQDTPYQMTVISKDLIENTASGIEQVFKMNPTVQVRYPTTSTDSWGGAIGMNIRGFSAVDNTIINGIPISSYYGAALSQDIEKIEVLNGLSGFLYGIGYVGGAVNYVTKKPTQERLTDLTVGSTSNQAFYAHLDLGGSIDQEGKFSYRFNAFKQNGETSIKDQKLDNSLISGALDWKVTDDLLLSFNASHKENNIDKLTASFSSNDAIGKLDPKQGYAPDWTFSDSSNDQLGLNALWQINNNIKLRAGYVYSEYERDTSQSWVYDNYDGTYRFNYYRMYPEKRIDQGAYVYTDFDFNTFGVEHTLTMGVSGTQRKNEANTAAAEFVNLGNYSLDQLNHILRPNYKANSSSTMYKSSTSTKINFMIGDDIKFNDQWSALIGLNYAKTESDSYSITGGKSPGYDGDKITPTLSVIYKPFEQLTTYATYMESLQNGIIVGSAYKNEGQVFAPYVSKQYELGTKYSVSENLLLSSALFKIEKANSYDDLTTQPKTFTQDGMQIHQGFELTLTGKVSDHLTIMGGGTIMDIEIEKALIYEGKKPTNTASKMAKLYGEYNIPAIEGLTITAGGYYTGKSYRDGANTDIIPAYTLFDAGLRYSTRVAGYPTKFIVNATNITDKKYWRSSSSFGEPRSIAFAIKTQF